MCMSRQGFESTSKISNFDLTEYSQVIQLDKGMGIIIIQVCIFALFAKP